MSNPKSSSRIGVYVDASNLERNGGYGMQYDVLREFACRDAAEPIRLNVYVSFDQERAHVDPAYSRKTNSYYNVLREFGFKVIQKNIKWYTDETGKRYGKANADLDMAVDALLQSENLERVILATGDGDFVQVVRALQNFGCRVEVVAFDNVASDLRREADLFVSGYLIPNLLLLKGYDSLPVWGESGSRVRGYCYYYDEQKSYGFLRYMKHISEALWITDSRNPNSPYGTAFFHLQDLPSSFNTQYLPGRNLIFEFGLIAPEGNSDRHPKAVNMNLITRY